MSETVWVPNLRKFRSTSGLAKCCYGADTVRIWCGYGAVRVWAMAWPLAASNEMGSGPTLEERSPGVSWRPSDKGARQGLLNLLCQLLKLKPVAW
jgi:hypothetical protein